MKDMDVNSEWLIEDAACPMCGGTEAGETPYSQPPFKVKRCKSCTLNFLSPRLAAEEANRFYQSDTYFSGGDGVSGYDDYAVQEQSLRATFRKLLDTIEAQCATGGSLLEVGCGPGYLLDEARDQFDTLSGVELSASAAKSARQRTSARIYLSIDEIEDAPAFDCIVATHVIEHIYEPVAFVESLAKRLKPGGSVILAAPHMGSIFRRIMGRHWPSFKYPEHVSFFDEKTLPDLFRRAGLDVVERVPYPHVFPLSLVLAKFGLRGPRWTDRINVTLPATTISFRAQHRSNG
ncbi:class I SAM-dependent methyltransferase [uncultured Roseobacter sp.]|uniref:class I SAM-dependent methyltransferase n=1 Tax=uncultured Roseobacter sp. TaxID=114847 RepID=UPI0026081675|nr:class I SAM-dependent methyltransferase [uncultured Roseobacter sp.]